jgi:hypothetical protein
VPERLLNEQKKLMKIGQRPKEDIVDDIATSARTEEAIERFILEFLLDIRDILKNR